MSDERAPTPRKVRLVRRADAPDDVEVVIRATLRDVDTTVLDVVDAALQSARTYVVEVSGAREVLFGVSVFALRDTSLLTVLSRFAMAPGFVRAAIGTLRVAGFEVVPTGTDPDHFDVQLLPGRRETDDAGSEIVQLVADAARRLIDVAGPIEHNPAYAGAEEEP